MLTARRIEVLYVFEAIIDEMAVMRIDWTNHRKAGPVSANVVEERLAIRPQRR